MTDKRKDGQTDGSGRNHNGASAIARALRVVGDSLRQLSVHLSVRPPVRLSVRPSVRLSVLLLSLAACGGSDGIQTFSPGDARFGAEQLIGQWSAELTDSLPCADTLASRTLVFGVGGDPGDVGPGGTLNFTSNWSAGTDPGGGVAGTVNLLNGEMELRLFRDGYTQAADLTGFIGSDGVLAGVLTDPYTGYPPVFGPSSCIFKVAALRVAAP